MFSQPQKGTGHSPQQRWGCVWLLRKGVASFPRLKNHMHFALLKQHPRAEHETHANAIAHVQALQARSSRLQACMYAYRYVRTHACMHTHHPHLCSHPEMQESRPLCRTMDQDVKQMLHMCVCLCALWQHTHGLGWGALIALEHLILSWSI